MCESGPPVSRILEIAAVAAAAALLGACSAPAPRSGPASAPARRIVALMPSFAEDLCAIGDGRAIVGVSAYAASRGCARGVPQVGNFASVDTEKIVALHPDAVVAIPAQRRLAEPLRRAGIRVVFLADDSFADIFTGISRLGELTGRRAAAAAEIARLQSQTARLRGHVRGGRRPSVFVVLQGQPIWTAGPQSYIAKLLELAGARDAAAALPRAYAQYSAEALLRLQPDAIVAPSDAHLASLLGREPWRSLRAVREHHLYVLSDPDVLERPGPHYNEGLSWLIERLRPKAT